MAGGLVAGRLLELAEREPERVVARVLAGASAAGDVELTAGALARGAHALAAGLRAAGVGEGDVVPLAIGTSPAAFSAILGCHLLGAAIAPVAPLESDRAARVRFSAERLAAVARSTGARLAVVERAARPLLAGEVGALELATLDDVAGGGGEVAPVGDDDARAALVQFSSGSTAEPKGVRVSFANIAANGGAMAARSRIAPADRMLCFLPLHHDFGLFTGILYPILWGIETNVAPTSAFVRRPSFWLRAMSRLGATLCPAPQFVYAVALAHIRDRELEGVDLARWRVSWNGGEPCHAATLRRFAARFGPWGLDPTVVMPSYGMAEATLAISIHPPGAPIEVDRVRRGALERGLAAEAGDGEAADEVVSCGPPLDGVELAILDEGGGERGEREVGEIALRGPSVADVYLERDGARALAPDGWFRTGDLGYLVGGRVQVTGRLKDLIIRGGRNYYPQDIEQAIASVDGVRLNGVVAFGVASGEAGERIVAVLERDTRDTRRLASLAERARRAVFDAMGLALDAVAIREKGWIPRTTSAKLQRSRARERFLEEGGL